MKALFDQIKFTPREKKLLYVLFIFLLLMGGWYFVLSPALKKTNELNVYYQETMNEHSNKQLQLLEIQKATQELPALREEIIQLKSDFEEILDNEDLSHDLSLLFINNGILPNSLNIDHFETVKLTDGTNENTDVRKVNIAVSIKGPFEVVTHLIDQINESKGMDVSAFNYRKPTRLESMYSYSMTISVYMCE